MGLLYYRLHHVICLDCGGQTQSVKDYLDSSKKTCPVGCDSVNTEKNGQEMVNQMDSDGDSKISYAEYQQAIIKNQGEGMLVLLRKAQADRNAAAAPGVQASPAPAAPAD
jgi:hypothetical protein